MVGLRSLLIPIFACALTVTSSRTLHADEIRLLSGAALEPALKELVPLFKTKTGHTVVVGYANIGVITDRVRQGEAADLAIISPQQWDALAKEGKLTTTTKAMIAKVGVGIAIKKGSAKPMLDSVEAFKHTMLKARSIAMSDPTGGSPAASYVMRLLDKLGVANELKPKITFTRGNSETFKLIASGSADIAFSQVSEIVAATELDLAGPLPSDVQNFTIFMAGIPMTARAIAPANALVGFLRSADSAKVFRLRGLEQDP